MTFIRSLTNGHRSLTFHLDSNHFSSCHRHSTTSTSKDKNHLCLKGIPSQWFSLHPASRGYFAITPQHSVPDDICLRDFPSYMTAILSFSLHISLVQSLIIACPWRCGQSRQFIGTHQQRLLISPQTLVVPNQQQIVLSFESDPPLCLLLGNLLETMFFWRLEILCLTRSFNEEMHARLSFVASSRCLNFLNGYNLIHKIRRNEKIIIKWN